MTIKKKKLKKQITKKALIRSKTGVFGFDKMAPKRFLHKVTRKV